MSVAEILHQIEALPQEERAILMQKLLESTPPANDVVPAISDAERAELGEKLAGRPNLGLELGQILDRMKVGYSLDLEEVKTLHRTLRELGR